MLQLVVDALESLIESLAVLDNGRISAAEGDVDSEQVNGLLTRLCESLEDELRDLIDSGENAQLEFKSTLRWNLHTDKVDKKIENQCLKTVAAYLDSDDGVLLVGVDDDGNAVGLGKDQFSNEDKMLLHWHSLVKSHLGLEFAHLIRSTFQDMDGKRMLVIQTLRSDTPVFYRRDND